MNIRELIESGSLELYVLGSLPADEMRHIDELRKQHPEVQSEIQRIEKTLEDFALAQARTPRPELKEEIAKRIGFGIELDLDMENIKTVIIHLKPLARLAAAASIALIIGFGGATFYYYAKYHKAGTELALLKQQQQALTQQAQTLSAENESMKQRLAILTSPQTRSIELKGQKISPESKAVIYWNKESGLAYINAAGMPPIAANEQFQLWAIVDGKPVDMGLINKDFAFAEMKAIKGAAAFAITLEPAGGSPTPTLEKMYVLGNV